MRFATESGLKINKKTFVLYERIKNLHYCKSNTSVNLICFVQNYILFFFASSMLIYDFFHISTNKLLLIQNPNLL